MKFSDFYIHLGRLIYAVAMADGRFQKTETERFYNILKEELIPLEDSRDVYGTDNAYYAEFELERLIDKKVDKNEAFASFVLFMENNRNSFDANLQKLSYDVAMKIAKAHAGIDSSECQLLNELKRKMNDLK